MKKEAFKKIADKERRRIREAIKNVEPGTEEYDKLLKQMQQLEDIEAKRRDGKVRTVDWFKFIAGLTLTGITLTADAWIPAIGSKLKLQEMVTRLIK